MDDIHLVGGSDKMRLITAALKSYYIFLEMTEDPDAERAKGIYEYIESELIRIELEEL